MENTIPSNRNTEQKPTREKQWDTDWVGAAWTKQGREPLFWLALTHIFGHI
jgi:hypothetical protein